MVEFIVEVAVIEVGFVVRIIVVKQLAGWLNFAKNL